MSLWRCVGVLAACLLLMAAAAGRADTLRPGYLEITQQDSGHWRVTWKAPLVGGLASHARPLFPDFCRFAARSTRLQVGSLMTIGTLSCDRPLTEHPVGLAGLESGFTDALLRISPLRQSIQVERLTPDRTTAKVAAAPTSGQVATTYLLLGVHHILAGYDHLLLVVGLVLLVLRPVAVLKAVTAFTAAHSITLAGATLGLFGLPQGPVEALIALSILFLAVEIVKRRPGQSRLGERTSWMVAFTFGLLHGFGFAGALRDIGLPDGDVTLALLTFNLGVELGQLVIVAATLGFVSLVRRMWPDLLRPAVVASSYAIGTVSAYWFIERLIG